MKKLLLSAFMLSASYFGAFAQLADGSVAPDFTFTDLNGNTQHLYAYLDSGKTVFIDVSAAWCSPCWQYHNTHALRDLYENHGPTGYSSVVAGTTNDVMVMFLEGEQSNTEAQLHGPAANTGAYATATQGDWVTGTTYPIVDVPSNAAGNAFMSGYNIAYFPTIYKICPNRIITEVGQLTADELYATVADCPAPATTSPDVSMMSYDADTYICNGSSHTPIVTIQNNSTTNLTNATVTITQGGNTVSTGTYTGNLASYGFTTVTCTPITNPTSGALVATVTTTDDILASNGIINTYLTIYSAAAAPLVQDFTSTAFPYSEYKVSSTSGDNWIYDAGKMKYACFDYTNGSKGDLYIEPVNLSSLADPSLSFDVAYRGYSSTTPENDKLEVFVSTNCGTTWTSVYNKQGTNLSTGAPQTSAFTPSTASDWRNEIVSLAAFAGQSEVFIKYVGTSKYGNNLYIDNINVASATSVEELEVGAFNVFPNPASDAVNVSFEANNNDYTVSLTDLQGRTIATKNLSKLNGTQLVTFSTENIAKGSYIVTIASNGLKRTKNVVVR